MGVEEMFWPCLDIGDGPGCRAKGRAGRKETLDIALLPSQNCKQVTEIKAKFPQKRNGLMLL